MVASSAAVAVVRLATSGVICLRLLPADRRLLVAEYATTTSIGRHAAAQRAWLSSDALSRYQLIVP